MKRRRIRMLSETMHNMLIHIENEKRIEFNFGSQSEATTTLGLNSDTDNLQCNTRFNVIQDWLDWVPGNFQFLMVQDETTSPGYCLLQIVRHDVPLPMPVLHVRGLQNEHVLIDDEGRMYVRHSFALGPINERKVRHGPSVSSVNGLDIVNAPTCLSWPKEALPWLEEQNVGGWPTADMMRYSADNGCFVVPVGSKNGVYEDLEWRISTSLTERCLMFSLNMTQIRSFILMKMILKSFIKPKCDETISSFMCKNVLFHCIADSRPSELRDCNLMSCLSKCLQGLFKSILTENCPHFMIPRNNLLAGKLSAAVKQQLVEIMCNLTCNIEQALFGISIDDLCSRIMVKSGHIKGGCLQSSANIAKIVSERNITHLLSDTLWWYIHDTYKNISNSGESIYQMIVQKVSKLCRAHLVGSPIEQAACRFFIPFYCSIVASVMASADIHRSHALSSETFLWFSAGLNSDFSTSKLKLASALYCVSNLERCEVLLAELQRPFGSEIVEHDCWCCRHFSCQNEFGRLCFERKEDVIKHNNAFCVKYMPCEVNCIPKELRYELFRPTVDDLPYRTRYDFCMDCAVVDPLPYLYFLQYKVYSQLRRPVDQNRALDNLARTIDTAKNLCHRETALNLLGQGVKQENRKEAALQFYMLSLKVRGKNNAAKWHLCILLAALLR